VIDRVTRFVLALVAAIAAGWTRLGAAIAEARNPAEIRVPAEPLDERSIIVSKSTMKLITEGAGFTVSDGEPLRSPKADAKRNALAYARKRTGNPNLSWKRARSLMNQWGREERDNTLEFRRA
jgi:hypothetical protein